LIVDPGVSNPGTPLAIAGLPSTTGQTGVAYLSHVTASGGAAPYSYSVASGNLPTGLSLDPLSGTVSGTPNLAGTYSSIVFAVSDTRGDSANSGPMTIVVSDPPPLMIAGSPSADAQVGNAYSAQFTAFDGSGTGYHFTSVGAPLPPGLQLTDTNGVSSMISGVPTHVGSYSGLQVRVTDSLGNTTNSNVFSITVRPSAGPALTLVGEPQPYSDIGQSYLATFGATGGTATGYVFDIVNGALPTGLTLSPSGTLSGTTTKVENATFTVRVTDSSGETAVQSFSISVATSLVLDSPALQDGTWGAAYNFALSVSGGVAPYRFSYSGSLPSGIMLDLNTGTFSGSTDLAGTIQTFLGSLSVLDTVGRIARANVSLTMYPPVSFTAFTPPTGAVGEPYSYVPAGAQGGSGHFSYQILDAATTKPSAALTAIGLALDPVSGAITGTPTKSGVSGMLIARATDSVRGSNSDQGPFSISIADRLAISGAPAVSATVGAAYSGAFTASGGSGGNAFSIASGSLPSWLVFDTSTGSFSGTPQVSDIGKVGPIQVVVSDAGGASAVSSPFEIQVVNAAMTASASMNSASKLRSGATIAGTLSSNRSAPTWSFSQSPPTPDLALSAAGSSFSGVAPAVAAKTSFSFSATGTAPDGTAQSPAMSVDVAGLFAVHGGVAGTGGSKVALTQNASASSNLAPLTDNLIGSASYALMKDGAPYALSSQCPGLSFDSSSGILTGIPTAACDTGLTLTMTVVDSWDGASTTTTIPFGIVVMPPLSAPAGNFVTSATAGSPYSSGPLTVTGGSTPYTWTMASGTLPGGLTLNPSTGALAGTPNVTGTFTFAVKVTDSANPAATSAASAWQTITVADATFSASPTSTTVHSDQPFSGSFSTTITSPTIGSSVSPSSWSLSLAITGGGTTWNGLAPILTTATPFTVTWTASTPDHSFSKTATTTVNVVPALGITGGATGVVSGQVGSPITATAAASTTNLLGSQSFALLQSGSNVSLGSLCPGLSFASNNAVIQGTPTAACSPQNLTIVATDSADGTTANSAPFSISVTVPVNLTVTLAGNSFINVTNGGTFSTSATVSGGSGSYVSAKIVSSQVKGLSASVSGNKVTISGSPLAQLSSGWVTLSLVVTDSNNNTGSAVAQLNIKVQLPIPIRTIATTTKRQRVLAARPSRALWARMRPLRAWLLESTCSSITAPAQ
jgi:large repetitive protein